MPLSELGNNVQRYSKVLKENILRLSELFRNDYSKASLEMVNVIDDISLLINSLNALISNNSINLILNEFNKKTEEILRAFENEDYFLVGDLLEYELCPLVECITYKVEEVYEKK